jgi:hypothetical protein
VLDFGLAKAFLADADGTNPEHSPADKDTIWVKLVVSDVHFPGPVLEPVGQLVAQTTITVRRKGNSFALAGAAACAFEVPRRFAQCPPRIDKG